MDLIEFEVRCSLRQLSGIHRHQRLLFLLLLLLLKLHSDGVVPVIVHARLLLLFSLKDLRTQRHLHENVLGKDAHASQIWMHVIILQHVLGWHVRVKS